MVISNTEYFSLFVITYALVGVLTPVMRKIAITNQILDLPTSSHKSHTKAVPYLGGVAILSGVTLVSYLALALFSFTVSNFLLATSVLGPALVMGLIGLWDDLKNLPPLPRFIGQSVAGLVVAAALVLGSNVANPTGSTFADVLITVIWVVGICNSINFFDNLDGGAAGTAAISAIFLTYLAINSGQAFVAALCIVVAGATLGFLIWNRAPARIYMGDAGALFLGVLLATLTIRLNPDTQTSIGSFATPILLLAIPILDTTVAVLSRLRRGVSPFLGGKDHLSHRLVRTGLSRKIAAIALWALSAIFALFAVILTFLSEKYEVYFVATTAFLWALLFLAFFRTADK
jgi:UDP-GlcNAc:undecaprenyl-phosphate/decaprenyl-phosphate GlcNAc-1-phosphate transferase